jgi:hypothetical protein
MIGIRALGIVTKGHLGIRPLAMVIQARSVGRG